MNKKEALCLGIFLVSFFLIGFLFFSSMNNSINLTLQNGKTVTSTVPAHFSLASAIALIILSAINGASLVYYSLNIGQKLQLSKKQSLGLKMLEGDVRKVYEYLLEKEECLQKDLVYELKLPKVKVTRILDKLDKKGLIKRISYGKTNKIVLE